MCMSRAIHFLIFTCVILWGIEGGAAVGAAGHAHAAHIHPPAQGQGSGVLDNLVRVYTPRRVCMYEEQPLIWLHVVSDAFIALAYYSIPLALIYFVRRRQDVAFSWMFWMFAAFILACGTTHVFGLWAIWQPLYWIDGLVKAGTAAVSVATAIALWFLIPHALMLRSPAQLEQMITERTAELAAANEFLRQQITARQAAEGRLEGIIGSAMDAIVTIDEDQRITLFNGAAERMFQCPAHEAIGKPLDGFIPPDLREIHHAHVRQFGETGVTVRAMQAHQRPLSAVRTDGEIFPVEATISQVSVNGQKFFTAIVRDVTERRAAEEEREQLLESERAARSEAERANRLKDEFLATVSHELRTPLNSILGWSELLSRSRGERELEDGLDAIRRNARTQVQLVEDLLDLSRIISGKMRLDVQRVDLPDVIEAAVQAVQPAAQAKSIAIQRMLDPLAGPVTGDPARLQQVMWNLLSNAIKFTPKEGRVQVRLERVNSHLEISVNDTGEGISPELLPHLFERFRQGDASTTRRHGGLGIGLALVRHLVELHGGSVRAKSPGEGQGATFTVCRCAWCMRRSSIRCGSIPHAEGARRRRSIRRFRGFRFWRSTMSRTRWSC
jgi:PAS domain S-box-containing protein